MLDIWLAKIKVHKNYFYRGLSSVGSEHLPYKQRVGGSTPSAPTNNYKAVFITAFLFMNKFFVYNQKIINAGSEHPDKVGRVGGSIK